MFRPMLRFATALPRAAATLAVLGAAAFVAPAAHGQQQYAVLHHFDCDQAIPDGWQPACQLTFLSRTSGPCLYGFAPGGGGFGTSGTTFRLTAASPDNPASDFLRLGTFTGQNGATPVGGLVLCDDGLLYGVCQSGGVVNSNAGVLFRLGPEVGQPEFLWEFGGAVGFHPTGKPLLLNGSLWGATPEGPPLPPKNLDGTQPPRPGAKSGAIYAYTLPDGPLSVACQLDTNRDMEDEVWLSNTRAGLVADSRGNLYGVASQNLYAVPDGYGAPLGTWGSIYRASPTGTTVSLTLVRPFYQSGSGDWPDGAKPIGKLVYDASKDLIYGVTERGGAYASGVIFSMTPAGGMQVLYSFQEATGWLPGEGLCLTGGGKLLGTTQKGGLYDRGVIFQYDPDSGTFRVLHDFSDTDLAVDAGGDPIPDGASPVSRETGLTPGGNGLYYGVTASGGANGQGVVYVIKAASVPPTTTASFDGPQPGSDWYTGPVTITLTATDPDGPDDVAATYYRLDGGTVQSYAGPFTVSDQGAHQVTFWSVDKAGATEDPPGSGSLKIDSIAPGVVWDALSPAPNAAGWNNGPVTLGFTASDAVPGSGLASVTPDSPLTFTSEGAGQTQTVTATDFAGNIQASVSPVVNIDVTPPVLIGKPDRAANGYGWYNGTVTVQFTASDALSGVAAVSDPVVLASEGAAQSATGSASDVAGNGAAVTVDGINIDLTAPVVTGSPDRPANAAGWYNAPVKVTFAATDALSGVATVSDPVVLSTEGASQGATGTARDKADNPGKLTVAGINIDLTPPTLSGNPDRPANAFGWYNAPVTITFTATDALSGVAGVSGPVTLSAEGVGQSAAGSASDVAGNQATLTAGGINIDKTAPVVNICADPLDLSPNNGRMVPVTVKGTAGDTLSGIAPGSVQYTVKDDYGLTQPSGSVTVNADGTYCFTVCLEARRDGQSTAGRNYVITVACTDKAGNAASASVTAFVPHDSGDTKLSPNKRGRK